MYQEWLSDSVRRIGSEQIKTLKEMVTVEVDCFGDKHSISYDPKYRALTLHDHPMTTIEDLQVQKALGALGNERPKCLKIYEAFQKDKLYMVRENDGSWFFAIEK